MNEVKIQNWTDFDAQVSAQIERYEQLRAQRMISISAPLFRGQADARWGLTTTLERYSPGAWTVRDYYRAVLAVHPAVTSLTGRAWPLPDGDIVEGNIGPPPAYEFLIYLRHYSFPSPLLDWSRYPYVAAFFAFQHPAPEGCEAVAVYSFTEYVGAGKIWEEASPRIIGLGSYAETHERHYSQQCEYTICKKPVEPHSNTYVYAPHDEAFRDRGPNPQDVLTKFIIPTTARRVFLSKLDSMNIHAYSLFRDETALMQMLAYREIEKYDRR